MKKAWIFLAVLLVCTLISTVSAAPITFDTACNIEVKYLGIGNADYHNMFGWVEGQPPGILHYLGTSQEPTTPVGSSWGIGERDVGENIILYLTNPNGQTFYSDPPSANQDNVEHVTVVGIDNFGYIVTIGYEDLYGGGDRDYNDVYLQVSCTPIDNQFPAPEFPTMAFPVALIIGMLGTVLFIQRFNNN